MYEYTCARCGKKMTAKSKIDIRMYCGKRCYGESLQQKFEREFSCTMPRLTDIHPDSYDSLVCAIVRQAREDVLHYSPDNLYRQDAEDFFLSDYFAMLTALDGFEILYQLTEIYNERQRRKANRRMKA